MWKARDGAALVMVLGLVGCRPEAAGGQIDSKVAAETSGVSPQSAPGSAPVVVTSAGGVRQYARPSQAELKQRLTSEQYKVTQEEGTEFPFHNEYWNNHEPGLYVDITTGEPLFSSTEKFESGTGWPSFWKPIDKAHVREKTDVSLGVGRTEVRSSVGDAHLGHVFDDGPKPTGLRYCINSASLRFIPVAKLDAEGYGEYKPLFANVK